MGLRFGNRMLIVCVPACHTRIVAVWSSSADLLFRMSARGSDSAARSSDRTWLGFGFGFGFGFGLGLGLGLGCAALSSDRALRRIAYGLLPLRPTTSEATAEGYCV